MKFENVLNELKKLNDVRPEICEKIKRHNLPVIIFGAGVAAKLVTEKLNAGGVEVSGYAVDEKYYQPNKTYLGCPVYNFAEISATPEKYVFVLGFYDEWCGGTRNIEFARNEKINSYGFIYKCFPNAVSLEFIEKNAAQFSETFNWLEDDLSRQTMVNFLKSKIFYDAKYNFETYHPNEYFNELTNGVMTPNGGGYVDCGAFNGDTVEKFIEFCGGNCGKIFAFEADPVNFAALEKFIREKNYKNVVAINAAVWNEKTTLTFSETNDTGSNVSEAGNIKVVADTIDNITGGEKISFIKMDIEGAELPSLQGAAQTIKKYQPTLAICAYHKAEDLITLPQFIKSLNPNYKIYLRKHSIFTDTELIIYAIPQKQEG